MKKMVSILLIITIFLSLSAMPVNAVSEAVAKKGKCGENAAWTYDKTAKTLTISGSGEIYDYSNGSKSPFFARWGIDTVIIEEGITRIGNYAFYYTHFNNIQLPDSLISIGNQALSLTDITTLNIPKNVQEIGVSSETAEVSSPLLYRMNDEGFPLLKLKTINVDEENQYYSSKDGVLFNKTCTELVLYPCGKKAKKYVVPDGVETIGKYAFWGSELKTVEFPNTLEIIKAKAFYASGLKSIDKYSKKLKTIGKSAFADSNIETFRVGKNVTNLAETAFMWCFELKKITVNKNNKYYSSKNGVLFSKDITKLIVFPKNKKADNYTIPDEVKTIGKSVFYGAEIKKLKIGKNVEKINVDSLRFCGNLEKIVVDSKNKKYSSVDGVLFSKNKKTLLLHPESKAKKYTIPDKVKKIGKYAFVLTNFEKVTISKSVKVISERAFYHCDWLQKVVFEGNKLPEIKEGAFNKGYDDGLTCCVLNAKYYVKDKSLKKELRQKLKKSGTKIFKIRVLKDK